jgi:hypothetical protein
MASFYTDSWRRKLHSPLQLTPRYLEEKEHQRKGIRPSRFQYRFEPVAAARYWPSVFREIIAQVGSCERSLPT